ncbi:MAG: hypothetical protein R2804_19330 [Cyclobacteriaceae bacterium]|jgi:hypothetical protein
MKIFPFGRIRALLFLGVVIAVLIVGIVQKCSGIESDAMDQPTFNRNDHR